MRHFIGIKQIEAEPDSLERGYRVRYPDGYESWSPREAFEEAYLRQGQQSHSDPSRISQALVEDFIVDTTTTRMGNHTVVKALLRNGFTIVEESACVDPANYDEKIGHDIALEKIKRQVWNHLGFVLAWARNGLNNGPSIGEDKG